MGKGSQSLSWSLSSKENQQFIGFRLECENPKRMSMTAAFYPRFQIYFRQKLMKEMKLKADNVICFRNHMHLYMDGHEIIIEWSDMSKSHIDVMVKCSQYKSREITVNYIEEHIIEELRKFCASSKGCPGIALVVGVLQTKCVEKLVPSVYRGDNQCILIRELKENFEAYVQSSKGSNSSLLNYEHYWPPVHGYIDGTFKLAKELLTENELESVMKNVLGKHEQQLKQLDQVSEEMKGEMDQIHCVSEVGDCCEPLPTNYPSKLDTTEPTIGRVLSRINRLEHRLEHKIDERCDGLERTLQRIENNMDKIISLQQQLQSSLSIFMMRLDNMIGYAESLERSKTPKRPYLSVDDVNIFQNVIALMRLGKAVRLHLLCESIAGPHIVKDQPGLQLCLEKENMQWLRSIFHISLNMMYYLTKAGLHVTLGLGQVVPELSTLEEGVSIATLAVKNITIDDSLISKSMEAGRDMTLDEAWNQLRNVLAPMLEKNYTSMFKLYRVKYLDLKEGGHAWVCEECMTRGIRNKILESMYL